MQKMKLDSAAEEILGIDLGTTNSAACIYNAGTVPTLLPIGENGKYTVPSCVRWDGDKDFTVGEEAYKERYKHNVIYSVKRMMGGTDKIMLHREVAKTLVLTPAEVSGIILRHIKEKVAECYKLVTDCVITVPAYFNQRQIEDTIEASKIAGLNCRQILKEPTSASYIYSLLGYASNGAVVIYDLGGGTFDVTHMKFLRKDAIPSKMFTSLKRQYGIELDKGAGVDNNDQYFCRVLGTYGDVQLGGDDIDKALGDHLVSRQNITLTSEGMEQLYLRCEDFKKSGIYGMDMVVEGKKIHVTTADLDVAVDKIFDKTLEIMQDIDMSEVKTIVLVGGSTKSQRIRQRLSAAFPGVEISAVLDPDATVALGAGSVAKAIANNSELMYADVLPLPIGVLVNEKFVDVCIAKNTSMPYVVSRQYFTLHDNQTQITVHVYQGLSDDPKECYYLGKITLTDIPKAPAGEIAVTVSFVLTGQGRLKIVSRIDGIDKEESLIVDNIFSVGEDAVGVGVDPKDESAPRDDFEECFMPLLAGNKDADELFLLRRDALSLGVSTTEYEDKIAALALSK